MHWSKSDHECCWYVNATILRRFYCNYYHFAGADYFGRFLSVYICNRRWNRDAFKKRGCKALPDYDRRPDSSISVFDHFHRSLQILPGSQPALTCKSTLTIVCAWLNYHFTSSSSARLHGPVLSHSTSTWCWRLRWHRTARGSSTLKKYTGWYVLLWQRHTVTIIREQGPSLQQFALWNKQKMTMQSLSTTPPSHSAMSGPWSGHGLRVSPLRYQLWRHRCCAEQLEGGSVQLPGICPNGWQVEDMGLDQR